MLKIKKFDKKQTRFANMNDPLRRKYEIQFKANGRLKSAFLIQWENITVDHQVVWYIVLKNSVLRFDELSGAIDMLKHVTREDEKIEEFASQLVLEGV